jgi:GAF domain-containing protein
MTGKTELFSTLLAKAAQLLAGPDNQQALADLCKLLRAGVPYYNWVGFYIVEPSGDMLRLGPFDGEPTEHVRIPFGKGICGQAAQTGKTFVVQDVTRETNYLACSLAVKSEIVLPIFQDGKVVAQLDIDSHTSNAFTKADQAFLARVCQMVADNCRWQGSQIDRAPSTPPQPRHLPGWPKS